MKKKTFQTASAILLLVFFSFKAEDKIKDWFLTGSNPEEYEIGIENDSARKGKVAFIKSKKSKTIKGFGTIMQSFDPEMFDGKKVKLTGYIKSNEVKGWAGMWMRVDGEKMSGVSFDNMQDRPIKGTTDWKKYEIVLDVPSSSKSINYGVLVSGAGEVWLDNLEFEVTGAAEQNSGRKKLMAPSNSNFEN